MSVTRVPVNLFGMPFGLTGLAGVWVTLADYHHAPVGVADTLLVLAGLVWLGVLLGYVRYAVAVPGSLRRDLLDPVAGPFTSLAVIIPVLLCAEGLYPHAATPGRVVLDIFVGLTALLGAWFTGQWIYGPMTLDSVHPGYFLPTVAGGLIASAGAAQVGQHRLAQTMFGWGMICWLVLGSIILGRLLFRPMLPPALVPTLAIEVAPAAVATLAYLALYGDQVDRWVAFLGGYGALMALAQLRLLPAYLALPFMPGTWAFTFSWAAVATVVLHWLQDTAPGGYRVYEDLDVAAITLFIGAVAVRTAVAIARRRFLPPHPTSPAPPAAAVPVPTAALTGEVGHALG